MALKIADQGQLIYAPVSAIWESVSQVSQWNRWVPNVRAVELLETPKPDAVGRILPLAGSPYYFRFTHVALETHLRWECPFRFGTTLTRSYSIIRNIEGAVTTLELWCEGTFERQVRALFRERLTRELLKQSLALKALCEGGSHEKNVKRPDAA